jgi:hypothetical protein
VTVVVQVQRKIKVVFIVQTNRSQTQVTNYVVNTIFPAWDSALATAFQGYQFPATAALKHPYVFPVPGTAGRFAVYPKYVIQTQVDGGEEILEETGGPTQQQIDVRNRYTTFIDDAKTRTRDLIASLSATTSVLQIYKFPADGRDTVVSTT